MAQDRSGLRVFHGAVAVVTGGASGIGLALSRALAGRGATVVLADRQAEEAEREAAAVRDAGGRAEAAPLDVRDAASFAALIEQVAAAHGRLDFLFNNAGLCILGQVHELTQQDWQDTIDVNLWGVIHGVQAAYPLMLRQGFGHIVNTASGAGLLPNPRGAPYCATKHAVVGLSRTLRAEAAGRGVRVSVLCPGVIRTPILSGGRFGRLPAGVSPEAVRGLYERTRPMAADKFAEDTLAKVAKNRSIIISPAHFRFVAFLLRLFPGLADAGATLNLRLTKAVFEDRGAGEG